MATATELPINVTADADAMAAEIFGAGVSVNTASYTGDPLSSGIYSNADTDTPGVAPGDTGVILSTGYVEDFTNGGGGTNTNLVANRSTDTAGVDNDAQFNALAAAGTSDAAILDINFTPQGDFITIDFVLASEEYPEYNTSQYNDVVGVWVNGVEATVTVGDGSASIGNINGNTTQNLYQDNTADQFNTEMDGFTITLTFVAPVNAGVPNDIRIGVADVADSLYDTNLLIAGGSVQSTIVAQDDQVSLGNNDTRIVDVLANDSSTGGTLTVTHIQGTRVFADDEVVLATGQTIRLNADGTLTVIGDGDAETVYFNYSVEDQNGATETALVEVTQVPCFVRGTRIETARGPVAIEELRPGDLIWTADAGLQPVRWIGQRTVRAHGANAPIRIAAGTLDAARDLHLSGNHAVLVRGWRAELACGTDEVLVRAKDLVGQPGITVEARWDIVTYLHLLLDDHHIIRAESTLCESFLPGVATLGPEAQAEVAALVDPASYRAARPILRRFEAQALLAA
ncbi:MAG: Hint domain-containing protein [Pseudomonadota bacterium]